MIKGIHGLLYSSDADASRAFFRDKLKLPFTDTGDGWLIFDLAEGDLGIHPTDHGGTAGDHDVSFYTDDLAGTVEELKAAGVDGIEDVQDHGYGLVTHLTVPGGIRVQLYQPKYQKAVRPPMASLVKTASAAPKKAKSKSKPAPRKKSAPAKKKSVSKGSASKKR
jgi:catechol 2,3-dioxygenase-like lactoylglutathione lyase family enzyme